jgi:hypothetical protein
LKLHRYLTEFGVQLGVVDGHRRTACKVFTELHVGRSE